MVTTKLEEQIVQLEERIAMLEEKLFQTNKPLISYAVEPSGDTLSFDFAPKDPLDILKQEQEQKKAQIAARQKEDEIDVSQTDLELMMHDVSNLNVTPGLRLK